MHAWWVADAGGLWAHAKQVLPGTDGETTTQGLDNLPACKG
jgi:hypothetical protein